MKLILKSDVETLGHKGDVVDVSDGYARNYLLPRGLADKATVSSVAAAEAAIASRAAASRRLREEAQGVANRLQGTRVVLAARAGDEGQLYGSVGLGDVLEGIRRFTGLELDRKSVELDEPIRAIGLHEVNVRLHPEVVVPLTIDVIPA